MNFIEKHKDYAPNTYYAVTNEEPEVINMLLGKQKFNKIASIASSGDVLLLSLLQRAVESIVAVDHSYQSLSAAYSKALLLKEHGVDKVRHMLLHEPVAAYSGLMGGIKEKLPQEIQKYSSLGLDQYSLGSLRREWFYTSKASVKRGLKNIGKLSFVHGDIIDLAEYGPFDLLYTSNAHEHSSRDKRGRSVNEFVRLLSNGGLLLLASGGAAVYPQHGTTTEYKTLKVFKGLRTNWYYHLIQRA